MERRDFLKILGVTGASAMAGGCVNPWAEERSILDDLPQATPVDLEKLIALGQVCTIEAQHDAKNPVVVIWSPEKSPLITIDTDARKLLYDGEVVLKWEKGACVFGTDIADSQQWVKAIPLSEPALIAHPIHKDHIHPNESYDWLNKFYPEDSKPEIDPLPKKYHLSFDTKQQKKYYKQYDDYQVERDRSFEYRKLVYDTAYKSLRQILDWQPANARLLNAEMRYDKKYNHLLAAVARVESGEGRLPGPNPQIINKFGYPGWFQMGTSERAASPLVKKAENGIFVWTGYEVGGKAVNSKTDYLHNTEAQILAMQNLLRQNFQNLYYFKPDDGMESDTLQDLRVVVPQADTSGSLIAAHLKGLKEARLVLLNLYDSQKYPYNETDGHGTSPKEYYKIFKGFPIYPYHRLPPDQKIGVDGFMVDTTRNRQR